MKNVKKVLAVLFAVTLVFALTSSAFATGTHTITINNNKANHTYKAYQIFTGDLSGDVLSNIQWGNGVKSADFLNALKSDTTIGSSFTACSTAKDVAGIISGTSFSDDDLEVFASIALDNASTTYYWDDSSTETGHGNEAASYVVTVPAEGYYLVTDSISGTVSEDAVSAHILKVLKDVEMAPKSEVPTLDKFIGESEKSVTDKKVGDIVPFTLKATLPASDTLDAYSTYFLEFNDTLSSGLEYVENSLEVYVGSGTTPLDSSKYTLDTSVAQKIKVTINDVKDAAVGATGGDTITVKYNAKITDAAVPTGNDNAVTLTYSHDPYNSSNHGTLPQKKVTVWTFDFELTKTFSDGNDHEATFELFRGTSSMGTRTVTTNGGKVTWADLADGSYTLTETVVPDGFNKADDVTFTITTATNIDGQRVSFGSTGNANVSANATSGIVSTGITNSEGKVLPTTGGIGTTIFYIIGSVLVLVAFVVFVTRRRMASRAQ